MYFKLCHAMCLCCKAVIKKLFISFIDIVRKFNSYDNKCDGSQAINVENNILLA